MFAFGEEFSHHELEFCDIGLESQRSLFGDVAILILDRTNFYLSPVSGSSLCGNLHSSNNSIASILPWDRSDMVLRSVDLVGSAQLGPDRFPVSPK